MVPCPPDVWTLPKKKLGVKYVQHFVVVINALWQVPVFPEEILVVDFYESSHPVEEANSFSVQVSALPHLVHVPVVRIRTVNKIIVVFFDQIEQKRLKVLHVIAEIS